MESLFSAQFRAADKSDWLHQVEKELKGTASFDSLRWQTDEGFLLDPYYTPEDLAQLPLSELQQVQKLTPGWLNTPEYFIRDEKAANELLRDALLCGADALLLTLSPEITLTQLLNGIKLSDTPVFFRFSSELSGAQLAEFIRSLKTIAPYQLRGGLLSSPASFSADLVRLTADSPQFRTICAGSHAFHNAGATASQELAFTLASLVDIYDTLTNEGLSFDLLTSNTILSMSVGTSYFLEIAKLRALRVLYYRLLAAYTATLPPAPPFIHAQTSTFYDASVTPYTNLIRATTESMAAVVGGCDALTTHPYNTVVGELPDPEFAHRLARNVSILLKNESYLDKVADPSAGSYYLEILTHQLAESAWALFLAVEQRGGYTKAMAEGFIQSELDRAYQAKLKAVQQGKVIVGVTKYRSDTDTGEVTPARKQEKHSGLRSDRRLAEAFE